VVSVTPQLRFTPMERTASTHCTVDGWAPGPVWTQRLQEKFFCRGSNADHPVVQPVVRHYTDSTTPTTVYNTLRKIFKHYQSFARESKAIHSHRNMFVDTKNAKIVPLGEPAPEKLSTFVQKPLSASLGM
jgi:hypothetical protein